MANAGYSGRPQAVKLGLKAGQRVGLHDAPPDWALTDPPDGLDEPGPGGQADVVVAFFTEAGEIGRRIGDLARRIYPAGALWIAWPRRAAGHRSDITDNVIREIVLPIGLVDVKVAAIDEDWSGLRVVWRTENRRLRLASLYGFHLTLKARTFLPRRRARDRVRRRAGRRGQGRRAPAHPA